MILVNFTENETFKLGVKSDVGIIDVEKATVLNSSQYDVPCTMDEIISSGTEGLRKLEIFIENFLKEPIKSVILSENDLKITPILSNPQKIICVGLNYRNHAIESNMPIPVSPILFNKYNNSIAGHGDKINVSSEAEELDYEAELAFVISKTAKNVSEEDALDYVLGYFNANDLSSRKLQFRTNQWLLGKTCDDFCPIGPYLVTSDDIKDPNNLRIRCYVNGETRQDSNTSDMIFNCKEIISYISKYMTLHPGDIILTGTPEGVIFGSKDDNPEWLKDGDEITIEIENLGRLTNKISINNN